ncbi:thermonuclease family protein [Streptomyces canus]|uniref:thermonuclease family protein n=1 Tax=Streptomyces canus TaxID=58343 RepID=UPI003250B3FF
MWNEQGTFVNQSLVLSGHAKAVLYPPKDKYWPRISNAQDAAQQARSGLWNERLPRAARDLHRSPKPARLACPGHPGTPRPPGRASRWCPRRGLLGPVRPRLGRPR